MAYQSIGWVIAQELLADGLWHPEKDILYKVAGRIPPNIAIREGEKQRQLVLKTRGKPITPRKRNLTLEELALYGAKFMARRAVLGSDRIQRGTANGVKYLRLRTRMVEPPPSNIPDIEIKLPNKIPIVQLSVDEQKKWLEEKNRKSIESRIRNQGLDPATHITKADKLRAKSAAFAALSPEEKKAWYQDKHQKMTAMVRARFNSDEEYHAYLSEVSKKSNRTLRSKFSSEEEYKKFMSERAKEANRARNEKRKETNEQTISDHTGSTSE